MRRQWSYSWRIPLGSSKISNPRHRLGSQPEGVDALPRDSRNIQRRTPYRGVQPTAGASTELPASLRRTVGLFDQARTNQRGKRSADHLRTELCFHLEAAQTQWCRSGVQGCEHSPLVHGGHRRDRCSQRKPSSPTGCMGLTIGTAFDALNRCARTGQNWSNRASFSGQDRIPHPHEQPGGYCLRVASFHRNEVQQ